MKILLLLAICAFISLLAFIERGCFAIGGEVFVMIAVMLFFSIQD